MMIESTSLTIHDDIIISKVQKYYNSVDRCHVSNMASVQTYISILVGSAYVCFKEVHYMFSLFP